MKRSTFILTFLFGSLLVGTGYSLWNFSGNKNVLVVPGIIEADDIQVGSKIGGRVLKVVAREGQTVKEGETLVLLEPGELDAALAEAQARFRQAEAKYSLLSAGFREEEIEQAEATAKQAQLELNRLISAPQQEEVAKAASEWIAEKSIVENSLKQLKRVEDLLKRDLVAKQEYSEALAKVDEAEQKMKAARERYDALLAGTRKEEIEAARHRATEADAKLRELHRGYRQQEIVHAKSELESARAKVQLIRAQLEETVIRSPADALVETLDLEPGDLVAAGKPVVTLLRTGSLWVRAYLSEAKLGFVQPGLKVRVRVDSVPDKNFAGVVRRIHRQGEPAPRDERPDKERVLQVYQTEVAIEDPEHVLRPGMNADVNVAKN